MTCVPFFDASCSITGAVNSLTGGVASVALNGLASGMHAALTWVLTELIPSWVKMPSPDLGHEPAINAIGAWLLPVTAAVAVGATIAAAARMALTRRATPLLDITGGLVTIAAVSSLGVALPALLLSAGDTWANWILNTSTHGQFSTRMTQLLTLNGLPAVLAVLLGFVAIVMVILQAVLLIFRQASIVLLAAVLPLAAAGSIAPLTRTWIRKVLSWMLALICYKPAAAAIYAAAFTMIGTGSNIQTALMGFAMIALSLVAMPALMRFFTWTTGTVASSGSGGFLPAIAGGAVAAGAAHTGPAGGAAAHAAHVAATSDPGPGGSTTSRSPSPVDPGSGTVTPTRPGTGPAPTAEAGTSTASPPATASTPPRPTSSSGAAAASVSTILAAQAAVNASRNLADSATEEGDHT